MLMPRLLETIFMTLDETPQRAKFIVAEPGPCCRLYGRDPELCSHSGMLDMHMRWLRSLIAVEEESVSANPHDRRHGLTVAIVVTVTIQFGRGTPATGESRAFRTIVQKTRLVARRESRRTCGGLRRQGQLAASALS
jgi:hypothetical protein